MQKSRKTTRNETATAARGRGRPRAFDRAAALEKAMLLFWRKGYEATSISDLTEAMGIGSPSLYAAFGPKEALYAEALRHYRETFDPPVWDSLESAGSVRDAIERYLMDAAAGLAPGPGARPTGCMVTLSSVSCEEHPALHELMRGEPGTEGMRQVEPQGDPIALQSRRDHAGFTTHDRGPNKRRMCGASGQAQQSFGIVSVDITAVEFDTATLECAEKRPVRRQRRLETQAQPVLRRVVGRLVVIAGPRPQATARSRGSPVPAR